jgi:nucleoside-diphosphate-sugar epimerase
MQTILGSNGIIGSLLAKELASNWTTNIKLVSRNPEKINEGDILFSGDLRDLKQSCEALENTEIAYLTAGLAYSSKIWMEEWPLIMENVIRACQEHNSKLVYFDNTYAYDQNINIQTEESPLNPSGKKGLAKKQAFELLFEAIKQSKIQAVICRAPEFYGPGKTKGITNTLVFEALKKHKKPSILLNDDSLRTLIFTPDAAKSLALIGNTQDTYGQVWHLPCDDIRLTYKQFIQEISKQLKRPIPYRILTSFVIKINSLFNSNSRETLELLPRYKSDNIFESKKFSNRFPQFQTTSYAKGIEQIITDFNLS